MARILQLDNFQVSPGRQGGEAYRAPSGEGTDYAARQLAQTSQNAAKAADNLQAVVLDQQTKQNEAEVKAADVGLSAQLRQILADPEKGFLNQRGVNAIGGRKATEDALQEAVRVAGEGMTNPATQRMWAEASARRLEMARGQVMEHTARETNTYRVESSAARVESALNDGMAHYNDPKALVVHKATMLGEIDELAQIKGMDAEQTKNARLAATSKFHSAIVGQFLANDRSGDAMAYLRKNEKEFEADEATKVRELIERDSLATESMKLSDRLSETGMSVGDQLKETKRLFKSGAITAELRDAAEQRVWKNQYDAERISGENAKIVTENLNLQGLSAANSAGVAGLIRARFGNGVRITEGARDPNSKLGKKNPGSFHNRPGGSAIDMARIPGVSGPQVAAYLESQGLVGVKFIDEYKNPSKHATGPHWHFQWEGYRADNAIKTDPNVMARLQQAETWDPQGFAKMDLTPYKANLSAADYNKTVGRQQAHAKKTADGIASLATYNRTLADLGPDLKIAGIEKERLAMFQVKLRDEIESTERRLKKQLSPDESRKLGHALLLEGSIEGTGIFRDDKKRFFEVTPEERGRFAAPGRPSLRSLTVPFDKIPAATKRRILDARARTGVTTPPTQKEIEITYAKGRERGFWK